MEEKNKNNINGVSPQAVFGNEINKQKRKPGRPKNTASKKIEKPRAKSQKNKLEKKSTKSKLQNLRDKAKKIETEKEMLTLTKKDSSENANKSNINIVAKNNKKEENINKPIVKNKVNVFSDSGKQGGKAKVLARDNTTKLLIALSLISLVLIMVVAGQFFVLENKFPSNLLREGTTINGVNVGGLSFKEAEIIIASTFSKKAERFDLTVNYKDKSWQFTKDDFTVNSEIHTIIEEANKRDAIGNSNELATQTLQEFNKQGVSIHVAFNYIFVGLDDKINEIVKEIEVEPTNSEIAFTPSGNKNFVITKESNGLRVNKEQLYFDINDQFVKSNTVVVTLCTVEEKPMITHADNVAQTKLISSFKTMVADSTGARKGNVSLALEKFNGMVVLPGEEISFNNVTGPHNTENGYKIATVIYNGQFVDGVGGGICQASTTLYNALLRANVDVLCVSKHTLPVKYVPLALDAMVSEYIADLKFKNINEFPIYIKTYANEESVNVEIYSHELKDNMEIKTRAEVIKTLPHPGDIIKPDNKGEYTNKVLFQGEQFRLTWPRDGFEAKAYLDYYKNGELVEEKQIRHEIYQPQNGIIIEGVEEVPSGMQPIANDITVQSAGLTGISEDVYKNLQDNAIPTFWAP